MLYISVNLLSCKVHKVIVKSPVIKMKMNPEDLQNINAANPIESVFFTNDQGQKVQLYENVSQNFYVEILSTPRNPYTYELTYFKSSLSLRSEVKMFYQSFTGIYKEYTEDGTLTNEIDYDLGYDFTIEKLTDKLKADFGIELMISPEKQTVLRYQNKKTGDPVYDILYDVNTSVRRQIIVDGKTGQILSDKLVTFG
jgi:hypothetical protein